MATRAECLAEIESERHCQSSERHRTYQPPQMWGRAFVAETLDPNDYVYYETCGLCGCFIRIVSLEEWTNRKGQE